MSAVSTRLTPRAQPLAPRGDAAQTADPQFNPHRDALAPGHTLHWYTIHGVLGQGGFGITYLAHDPNLDQPVAIKEYLPRELAARDGDQSLHPISPQHREGFLWGLQRFLEEARTLGHFEHRNIVRVLAVFEMNGTAYMVMAYENGRSFQEMLPPGATLEQGWLTRMIFPVMDGLRRVHGAGFIHRDIKPGNLYIREDQSAVLLDFGSARQAMVGATRTLTTLVSPGYAPFEQYHARSDRQGPWTDVYGLGATLFRAVTGEMPLDAMSRSESLLGNGRDSYIRAAELAGERYDAAFLDAIDHALAFRECERPQSVGEWAAELRGARAGTRPVVACVNGLQRGFAPGRPSETARRATRARPGTARLSRRQTARRVGLVAGLLAAVLGYAMRPGNLDAGGVAPAAGKAVLVEIDPLSAADLAPAQPPSLAPGPAPRGMGDIDVNGQLDSAWADVRALRLSGPGADNAAARYRRVLAVDPRNQEALSGLRAIRDYLVARSRRGAGF